MHDQLPAYFDDELDAGPGPRVRGAPRRLPRLRARTCGIARFAVRTAELLRHRPPSDLEGRVGNRRSGPAGDVRGAPALDHDADRGSRPGRGHPGRANLTLAVRISARRRTLGSGGHIEPRPIMVSRASFSTRIDRQAHRQPWFQGKTDFSPPSWTLRIKAFIGRRTARLSRRPNGGGDADRRHQHVINLFVWPAVDGRDVVM